VAEPVLLISSDSFLGASLEAVAPGRVRVARLDPSQRPVAWPAEPAATVVLDVTARQRDAFHAWVRRHHPGPLVVVLKPGERRPALPPDPDLVVVGRPFRLVDLVTILEHPPAPPGPGPGAPVTPVRRGAGRGARNLLQASTEQRMRRLGSLSGSARPPGPPAASPTAYLDPPPPRRSGRRVVVRVLVGLLVLLVLAAAWFAFGLLEGRQDLLVGATLDLHG
jgi:hypothetical protein